MKIFANLLQSRSSVALLGIALATQLTATAQPTNSTSPQPAFANDKDKLSYAFGVLLGDNLKRIRGIQSSDLNVESLVNTMKDSLDGKEPTVPIKDLQAAITAFQRQKQEEFAAKNLKAANDFLASNKTKEGIKTMTVNLPGGKSDEIQYKVMAEGSGDSPSSNDTVMVQYTGTLTDGKEFDGTRDPKRHPGGAARAHAAQPGRARVGCRPRAYESGREMAGVHPAGSRLWCKRQSTSGNRSEFRHHF